MNPNFQIWFPNMHPKLTFRELNIKNIMNAFGFRSKWGSIVKLLITTFRRSIMSLLCKFEICSSVLSPIFWSTQPYYILKTIWCESDDISQIFLFNTQQSFYIWENKLHHKIQLYYKTNSDLNINYTSFLWDLGLLFEILVHDCAHIVLRRFKGQKPLPFHVLLIPTVWTFTATHYLYPNLKFKSLIL